MEPTHPEAAGELGAQVSHDYSSSQHGVVPLNERRGTWSHHVPLWLTFYPGFAYMALGFELYGEGFTLRRMLFCVAVSSVCYFAYAVPAAYLGATRGQTTTLMSRSIFGVAGSGLVSLLVMIVPLGWVGYQANLLGSMWSGLFGWGSVLTLGIVIAVLGVGNNILGFTGISMFARYVAAPLTLLWVLYTLVKSITDTPDRVLSSHGPGTTTTVAVIILAISFATYSNEPDLFRYAKPRWRDRVPPLAIGLFVRQFLLPTAARSCRPRRKWRLRQGVHATVTFSSFGLALAFVLATATQSPSTTPTTTCR